MLPSITASGLGPLERADQRLARSAETFTRNAEPAAVDDPGAAPSDGETVVDAAVGVIYGRTAFATGVALLEVGRDTDKALLDVLA
jgi:hypothetical protein